MYTAARWRLSAPFRLATYIAMFPQLIAGPIVRYRDVERTLTERHTTAEDLGQGLTRFVLGLSKKVLLANQLGAFAAALQSSGEQTVLLAWLCLKLYDEPVRRFLSKHLLRTEKQ